MLQLCKQTLREIARMSLERPSHLDNILQTKSVESLDQWQTINKQHLPALSREMVRWILFFRKKTRLQQTLGPSINPRFKRLASTIVLLDRKARDKEHLSTKDLSQERGARRKVALLWQDPCHSSMMVSRSLHLENEVSLSNLLKDLDQSHL